MKELQDINYQLQIQLARAEMRLKLADQAFKAVASLLAEEGVRDALSCYVMFQVLETAVADYLRASEA